MRNVLCTIGTILLVWAGTAVAMPVLGSEATWIGGSYTETVLPEQSHKDTTANVNWLVNNWEGGLDLPTNLTLLGKWEVNSENYWTGTWDDSTDPGFLINGYKSSGSWSGSWIAPSDWDPNAPIYFSVKAGSSNGNSNGGFQLYYYDTLFFLGGRLAGLWDTDRLDGKALSHISFWTATPPDTPSNPVPEPTTMGLVGLGILAFAGIRRRKVQR